MLAPFTITVPRGVDATIKFTPDSTQTVTDITGWTLQFTVRRSYGGPILFSKTSSQITIVSATAGTFNVPIAQADTQGGATSTGDGVFYWDVRRIDNGANDYLRGGSFVVSQQAYFQ